MHFVIPVLPSWAHQLVDSTALTASYLLLLSPGAVSWKFTSLLNVKFSHLLGTVASLRSSVSYSVKHAFYSL